MKKFNPENIIIFQISLILLVFIFFLVKSLFFQSEEDIRKAKQEEYRLQKILEAKKPENNLYFLCEKENPNPWGYNINKIEEKLTEYYVVQYEMFQHKHYREKPIRESRPHLSKLDLIMIWNDKYELPYEEGIYLKSKYYKTSFLNRTNLKLYRSENNFSDFLGDRSLIDDPSNLEIDCENTDQENMIKSLNIIANERLKKYRSELKGIKF